MLRRAPIGVFVALAIVATFACSSGDDDEEDDNNFREDVVSCEEALARLERCCPDFDARPISCEHYYAKRTGCGTTTTESISPALSTSESRCVRERSCEELVSSGVCTRAREARAYTSRVQESHDDAGAPQVTREVEDHPRVCP